MKDQASIECQRDWSEFERHTTEEENGIVQRREKEKAKLTMCSTPSTNTSDCPIARIGEWGGTEDGLEASSCCKRA